MPPFAPENILRASLKVLHVAAFTTRNWTLSDEVSRRQINDLWEAIHVIPDVIKRWPGDERGLRELRMYLREYTEKWQSPDLLDMFERELRVEDA